MYWLETVTRANPWRVSVLMLICCLPLSQPLLTNFLPVNSASTGGGTITLTGFSFDYGATGKDTSPTAQIQGNDCASTTWGSATTLVCNAAPGGLGMANTAATGWVGRFGGISVDLSNSNAVARFTFDCSFALCLPLILIALL